MRVFSLGRGALSNHSSPLEKGMFSLVNTDINKEVIAVD